MNVKFRTSLSGFNREEVINYIKKLAAEKNRAENTALENANKLDDAEYCIGELKNQLEEEVSKRDEKIASLETDIAEKDEHIGQLEEKVRELSEKLSTIRDDFNRNIAPAKDKASDAEVALRGMASELYELSERVKKAHADISDTVVTIEDCTRE